MLSFGSEWGKRRSNFSYFGEAIPVAGIVHDLGLFVDDKLSFYVQFSQIVKKASRIVNFIYATFMTKETSFLMRLDTNYVLIVLDK